MTEQVVEGVGSSPVIQFSVFLENKVGRLSEFIRMLSNNDIHIMAMTVLDTTDSSIIRIVVDDPDQASSVLYLQGYSYTESILLAVELDTVEDVPRLLSTILGAEINVHYLYPFLYRPQGKSAVAMHLEEMDMAAEVIKQHQFRVLTQNDISR